MKNLHIVILGLLIAHIAAGCVHQHSDRNAPGTIEDIRKPPRDPYSMVPQQPGDPGERLTALSTGAFGGVDVLDSDGSQDPFFTLGVETTLRMGQHPRSHYDDNFLIFPMKGWGGSLGLELVGQNRFNIGPLHAEVMAFWAVFSASAGYAFDIDDLEHGPQLTVNGGPMFIRLRHLFGGQGTSLVIGLEVKLPQVWVESM